MACWTQSRISCVRAASAMGQAGEGEWLLARCLVGDWGFGGEDKPADCACSVILIGRGTDG